MKTKYLVPLCVFSVAAAIGVGCGDSKNNAPSEDHADWTTSFGATPEDAAADPLVYKIPSNNVTVSEAKLYAKNIKLQLPEGVQCDDTRLDNSQTNVDCEDGEDSSSFKIPGPFVVDLIAKTITPAQGEFKAPPGSYQKVTFELGEGAEEDGVLEAGDPLIGNSVYLKGEFSHESQGEEHEIQVKLLVEQTFSLEQEDALELVKGDSAVLAFAFDQREWMSEIDLEACLDANDLSYDGDDKLIISESTVGTNDCATIQADIEANILANASVTMTKSEE